MLQDPKTPRDILRQIEREEEARHRGRLKIFFGYAAGVGKTYAMLQAAHDAAEQGIDVVAGYIEPHTRPQTMALLEGLEQLPARQLLYKGVQLREFDLDRAIERHPQLLLVDELAHQNAEGCRHQKRYQDIEELLAAGIDVYTTVNVQHIESLNDIVASITGVSVRERIPDRVFDGADQVELVDIEPEDLLARLRDGKVYQPRQARQAMGHFFSLENLTALREIALRRTADRVNRVGERSKQSSGSDYYTGEHILVCLSSSPSNAKIIRTAARMALAFRGTFTALFVETTGFASMNRKDRDRLRQNIHLAQQLGARIETVYGDDVPYQIAEFARIVGVSKIVIGRSGTQRRLGLRRRSLSEQLATYSPNLDIYIIPDRELPPYRPRPVPRTDRARPAVEFAKCLGILLAVTLVGIGFDRLGFSDVNIITVYILGVLLSAVATNGLVYSGVMSLASVLIFNFLFTQPRFTFNAYDQGYPVTFVIMFAAAFITGSLAGKIKKQAKQSAMVAYRTKVLLETNQMLQQKQEQRDIVSVTAGQLIKLLDRDVVFYLPEDGSLGQPTLFSSQSGAEHQDLLDENERAVAHWVYKNNKRAGAGTSTLGSAQCQYLAVRGANAVYGVVGIALESDEPDSFTYSLVLSILGECGLALEKELLVQKREEAAARAKNEQLRANLLRSISHDLRTPLTSISGNAGVLLASADSLSKAKQKQLYGDIYDDAMWLINLVENLLSVTRIEDGTMQIHTQAELVEEVIDEALRHLPRHSDQYHIDVQCSDELLLAKMDARLIVQVVINILDNAIKYTPPGSTIVLTSQKQGDMVAVEIADNGPGIPDEQKKRVFEMFYTLGSDIADSRRSMGMGLALCKSIVNAHGGQITVRDNQPQGTVFCFTLPAEEVTLHE